MYSGIWHTGSALKSSDSERVSKGPLCQREVVVLVDTELSSGRRRYLELVTLKVPQLAGGLATNTTLTHTTLPAFCAEYHTHTHTHTCETRITGTKPGNLPAPPSTNSYPVIHPGACALPTNPTTS